MSLFDAFRYDGKRALVVGGATGMGAAVAELAVDAGAEVVVMDRAPVTQSGVKAISLDLSDRASIDGALDECGGPVHALFSCVAEQKTPPTALLAILAGHLGAGFEQARLVFHDGTLRWAPGALTALDDVTRELARAAANLVGSDSLGRVRACAAEDCRWWFIDDTRNHSRRWCDMKTCGNRAKLRRYRARQ